VNEVQQLIDQLDDPALTAARWRELLAQAEPLIDALEVPELVEPFLMVGAAHGWERDVA
jgi:hypothetical protein